MAAMDEISSAISKAERDALIAAALEVRARAHAPYSRFHVGSAVLGPGGEIARGANVENGCYRLGVCAEQSALSAAQIAFGLDKVRAIAVAGGEGEPVVPCGGCRQAIAEAAQASGEDVAILMVNGDGSAMNATTIAQSLPDAFEFDGSPGR